MDIVVVIVIVLLGGTGAFLWFKYGDEFKRKRLESEIEAEVEAGRYHRAVPYYIERGQLKEAARLEVLRGNTDKAAKLYERTGDMEAAAKVYRDKGDFEMAALTLKSAGNTEHAAEAFVRAGQAQKAIHLYIKEGNLDRAYELAKESGDLKVQAGLAAKLGRPEQAHELYATSAEQNSRFAEAATHWIAIEETEKAAHAWKLAGEHVKAAEAFLTLNEYAKAAALFAKGEQYAEAAEAFEKIDEAQKAAHAWELAGQIDRADAILEKAEIWLDLAHLRGRADKVDEALAALDNISSGDPDYLDAQRLALEVYRRSGMTEDCFDTYHSLVRLHIQKGIANDETRTWIVAMADMLYKKERPADAINLLKDLSELRLETPETKSRAVKWQAEIRKEQEKAAKVTSSTKPTHSRYEFIGHVGEGGNGVIHRARDTMLDRIVAIKMIGQTALPDQMAKEYFLREAQTAAALNHPNIVTIFDLGEIEGRMYIAMELIDGESLAESMEREGGAMAADIVVPIISKVCNALDFAHKHKVVHRDVKLENVMISKENEVKLMDFGLAKAIKETPNKSVVITGTPLYMSPEQIQGQDVDHRTDLYALGVMIYYMLVGQWPFSENILVSHLQKPVPNPCELNENLPEGFKPIAEKLLAKQKSDRYDSAAAVVHDLQAAFSA